MADDKTVSVSLKMAPSEIAALDLFALSLEAELLKRGLRISVSRAAAIRTLIERGLPLQPSEQASPEAPLTPAAEPVDSEEERP